MIDYFSDVLNVVRDSVESIDVEVYNRLVDECEQTIKGGYKIIASGLGKNVPICEKFVGTLNSLGIDARFLHTNTAVHGDLGMVGKKDLVIPCSERMQVVAGCRYVDQVEELPIDRAGIMDAYHMFHFDCMFSGDNHVNDPGWLAERERLRKVGSDIIFV